MPKTGSLSPCGNTLEVNAKNALRSKSVLKLKIWVFESRFGVSFGLKSVNAADFYVRPTISGLPRRGRPPIKPAKTKGKMKIWQFLTNFSKFGKNWQKKIFSFKNF